MNKASQLALAADNPLVQSSPDQIDPMATLGLVNPLGDSHYAISETLLDQARDGHNGNWLTHNYNEFTTAFGSLLEAESDSDDDDNIRVHCEKKYCSGLCQRHFTQAVLQSFRRLEESMKDILRRSRAERRSDGFSAKHVPLLPCQPSGDDKIELVEVYMLCRISFSPFDGTAVEFKPLPDLKAKLVVTQGPAGPRTAQFKALPKLLFHFVHVMDSNNELSLATANYQARNLNEVEFSAMTMGKDIPIMNDQDDLVSDEEHGDTDKLFASLTHVLQTALGKQTKSSQPRHTRQSGHGKDQKVKKAKACQKQNNKVDGAHQEQPSNPNEPGLAGQTSALIENEWGTAVEAELGPVKCVPVDEPKPASSEPPPSAASSSSRACGGGGGGDGVPILSKTHPWRDAQGYAWAFSVDTGKAVHLGQGLVVKAEYYKL